MAQPLPHAEPEPRVLDRAEARAFFDTQARALLGISGTEFLERWDRGEFADQGAEPEDTTILELALLIPFGR